MPPHFWVAGEGVDLIRWCRRQLSNGAPFEALVLPLKSRFGEFGLAALELAAGAAKAVECSGMPAFELVHREAYEQSSKPPFNTFHAGLFSGVSTVLEVGAGLGVDTVALAKVCKRVISLEPNQQKASYLKHNLEGLGISNVEVKVLRFEDCHQELDDVDGIFADPNRRVDGARVRDPESCQPPLSLLLEHGTGKRIAIKLSPTVGHLDVPLGFTRCVVGGEFDARELLVTNAELGAPAPPAVSRCILLDQAGHRYDLAVESCEHLEPISIESCRFLYEIHPALASTFGGVAHLCQEFNLRLVTTEHGYLASMEQRECRPWAKRFEILETVSLRKERIQELIARHQLGKDTAVKKREGGIDPNELHRSLRWSTEGMGRTEAQRALILVNGKAKQWCCLVRAV